MDLRRNQALRASMHVCGDAVADQRDAASRSRAWQIVTTIPIQRHRQKLVGKRGEEEEQENTLESRRLLRRILSRTVVSEPLLPLAFVGFSLPSLFSSPSSKSIGVSGIITLSLGYPPIPRCCCCEIFQVYTTISLDNAGTREEIDTI